MKKVLVTGSDGFIGSHLVEELLECGYDIRAYVCYNSFNSWGWLEQLPPDKLDAVEVIPGDIRDPNSVRDAMQGVDKVFHLAALIAIPFSYQSPDSYVDTNIKGTMNVLQAARDCDAGHLLVTSSSEVYGTADYVPIDEVHPLKAQSPYSATKIGAEKIAESFNRSFDLPLTIVRPFNTYGPRQSARAVIPSIIIQLLAGSRQLKLGNLDPSRDFNYVTDICRGFISIAESDKFIGGDVVNIGSGTEITIRDLAAQLVKMLNPDAEIIEDTGRKRVSGSEVERLLACNRKICSIGWTPQVGLEDGLGRTIDWLKNNMQGYKPFQYNI